MIIGCSLLEFCRNHCHCRELCDAWEAHAASTPKELRLLYSEWGTSKQVYFARFRPALDHLRTTAAEGKHGALHRANGEGNVLGETFLSSSEVTPKEQPAEETGVRDGCHIGAEGATRYRLQAVPAGTGYSVSGYYAAYLDMWAAVLRYAGKGMDGDVKEYHDGYGQYCDLVMEFKTIRGKPHITMQPHHIEL